MIISEINTEGTAIKSDLEVLPADARDKIANQFVWMRITDLPCWQDLKAMREKKAMMAKQWLGMEVGVEDGIIYRQKCIE